MKSQDDETITLTLTGNVCAEELSEILRLHFASTDRNVWIDNGDPATMPSMYEDSNEDDLVIGFLASEKCDGRISELHNELIWKNKEISELKKTTAKALDSVQTLQRQRQVIYDRFVSLRQAFDEQKLSLLNTLWIHCGAYHPDLREIPVLEDMAKIVETEDRVGEFQVGEILGQGQFATVRSCCRDGSELGLAVKIIKKDRFTTFTALKRISNEIKILRRLRSDFIVSVKDVVQTMNNLYIVTERGGYDLFESFDDIPDGIPESWAKEIIVCVLKAVLYCHDQGICHRDLKPENILLTFDKKQGKCIDLKLCDFGLSTKFNSSSLLTDFCGSPGFFAPEMIITGHYEGDKVDIWSTGCVLLELLFGHRRFNDIWMIAYDYELLQSKDLFIIEIKETVEKLPLALNFSSELNDFILQFLLVLNSKDRPRIRTVCTHPWLCGGLDCILNPPNLSSKSCLANSSIRVPNLIIRSSSTSPKGSSVTNNNTNSNNNNNNNLNIYDNNIHIHNNNSSNNNNNNDHSTNIDIKSTSLIYGLNNELTRSQPGSPSDPLLSLHKNQQFKSIMTNKTQMEDNITYNQNNENNQNSPKFNIIPNNSNYGHSDSNSNNYNNNDNISNNNHNKNNNKININSNINYQNNDDNSNNNNNNNNNINDVNNNNNSNNNINNDDNNNNNNNNSNYINNNNNNNSNNNVSSYNNITKLTLPSISVQSSPRESITASILGQYAHLSTGPLSSRERDKDRDREIEKMKENYREREKEKEKENLFIDKTNRIESPRSLLVSKSQAALLNTRGLSGLDSKERALLENYIRSRSSSFVGSPIPSRRTAMGDVIAMADMTNWNKSYKNIHNSNKNNNTNTNINNNVINNSNSNSNNCNSNDDSNNIISHCASNSYSNSSNNSLNVTNLFISDSYINENIRFNMKNIKHRNDTENNNNINNNNGNNYNNNNINPSHNLHDGDNSERRGSDGSERRGSGGTVGSGKYSAITLSGSHESLNYTAAPLAPLIDHNNNNSSNIDSSNNNDNYYNYYKNKNNDNSNHNSNCNDNSNDNINNNNNNNNNTEQNLLALQLEKAVVGYDWSNLSHYINNNNNNNDDNDNNDKNNDNSNSNKHLGAQDLERSKSPYSADTYNSSKVEATKNSVSFHGYGNHNYTAPRGSFAQISDKVLGSTRNSFLNERKLYGNDQNVEGSALDDERS